jgi:hypothetical protein
MCYNASVHYWHVTRVLQRPGVRAPLLPSMEAVVKAVDGVPGQEEWKVQLRTSLALTYAEAGRPADAAKAADEAYALAKDKVRGVGALAGAQPGALASFQHRSPTPGGTAGKRGRSSARNRQRRNAITYPPAPPRGRG